MLCKHIEQSLRFKLLFIHSFVPYISVAPLQVHYYAEALPTTAMILCRIILLIVNN